MQDIFIGVDVARDWLDIDDPVGGPRETVRNSV